MYGTEDLHSAAEDFHIKRCMTANGQGTQTEAMCGPGIKTRIHLGDRAEFLVNNSTGGPGPSYTTSVDR